MLKGLFSAGELFTQIFGTEGEEAVRRFGETFFNAGFNLGYNARKEEEKQEGGK